MKYLHLFETVSAFTENRSGNYEEPWASYTVENDKVDYNKTEKERLLGTPLTFNVTSNGNIVWTMVADGWTGDSPAIEYKKNNGEWTEVTLSSGSPLQISVVNGDKVQFRADNNSYAPWDNGGYYVYVGDTTCGFNLEGNIMSIFDSQNFANMTEFPEGQGSVFGYNRGFFAGCTGLTSASDLQLPAMNIPGSAYRGFFSACTSLTSAPDLPATAITERSYDSMFRGCSSLVDAPKISLAEILNGELGDGYQCESMFEGCTSLQIAPEFTAMTLGKTCYRYAFRGCTSLTKAPELPATALSTYCYLGMFSGCTGLVNAPVLNATALSTYCYSSMFAGCTSLTNVQAVLPATTLTSNCYSFMFQGCTSLVKAPELPAETVLSNSYASMFKNCSSLNYIKCLATSISATNAVLTWVDGVASSGTFVKAASMSSWPSGASGIPNNWTVQDA